jgi:hypothetical protein
MTTPTVFETRRHGNPLIAAIGPAITTAQQLPRSTQHQPGDRSPRRPTNAVVNQSKEAK